MSRAKPRELQGCKFGRLQVLSRADKKRYRAWLCQCDCGTQKIVLEQSMLGGRSKSCGCLRKDVVRKKNQTHRMSGTKPYGVWVQMKRRCEAGGEYFGTGISVCQRWKHFEGFWGDMGASYREGLSIDRIDNYGNYEPGNCHWATRSQQNRNKRNVRMYRYSGKSDCLMGWSEALSIDYNWLRYRLSVLRWPIKKCIRAWGKS